MKYFVNILAVVFLGWPALLVGYAFSAVSVGYQIGRSMYDRHESDCIDKFTRRESK